MFNETVVTEDLTLSGDNSSPEVVDVLKWSIYAVAIMFFSCACTRRTIPAEHLQRGEQIRANAREQRRVRERQAKLADPTLRAKAIEQVLIMQQIRDVDSNGDMTLGDIDPERAVVENQNSTLEEEDDSACVICLEPFQVGEVVGMSRKIVEGKSECPHVFHRQCIVSWLQNTKHDDCPSCRTILLVDTSSGDEMEKEDVDADDGGEVARASIAYVIMNGLVSRVLEAKHSLMSRRPSPVNAPRLCFESDDSDSETREPRIPFFAGSTSSLLGSLALGEPKDQDRFHQDEPGNISGKSELPCHCDTFKSINNEQDDISIENQATEETDDDMTASPPRNAELRER